MLSAAATKLGRTVPTAFFSSSKLVSETFGSQSFARMAHHPELKYDTPFNFAAASGQDAFVYGSGRPKATNQGDSPSADKVSEQAVKEWADFMKERGITRVVGLLSDKEIGTYEKPPVETLRSLGFKAVNVHVGQTEADRAQTGPQLVQELKEATAAGEKVVVHCWAGGKRSGSVLAAWLVAQHNLSPEAAVQELKRTAESQGSTRPADAQWATQYVAGIKL